MSQGNTNIAADYLHKEVFNIKYEWEKFLQQEVFQYHDLISKECNAPVDLQMGNILSFVTSCVGPNTKGVFLTRPSCLNLFWIVVGASGVGKSQSCKHFITEPLKYVLNSGHVSLPDSEISKFTRAGKFSIYYEHSLYSIPYDYNRCE